MTQTLRGIALLSVLILVTAPVHARPQEDSSSSDGVAVVLDWDDGPVIRVGDSVDLRIGGRLHADWVFWGDSDAVEARLGELEGDSEFRRARLHMQGALGDDLEFRLEYDFAGDGIFRDVYFGSTGHRVDVRAGHFKEPFSLNELISDNNTTFVERGLPNVFAPSRNVGVMAFGAGAGGRASWAAGVFRESDGLDLSSGDDYNFTGRFTGTAWETDDALLHLGGSASYKSVDPISTLRFRQRPEIHVAPRFVDSGPFVADSATLLGAEAALITGPFSAQGEYIRAAMDAAGAGDPAFSGYYVLGSFVLTGESRGYRGGVLRSVAPARSFLPGGGPGAWEVAARISGLDLDDGGLRGGELTDLTLGVNWYWNTHVRMMFNVVRADRSGVGEATAFALRWQLNY